LKNKRLLMLIGSLCLILVLVTLLLPACAKEEAPPEAAEEATYHFKFATDMPAPAPATVASISFAEAVLEASDGRIVIDVHHSAILGDWIPVTGEVMKGTIEMGTTYVASVYDPRMEFVYLPYLVTSWEEVSELLSTGGALHDMFVEMGRDLGYETLCSFPSGFSGIGTSEAIPSPADPDVAKGLKIRHWAAKAPELTLARLGFITTVVPWADVYPALQTGVAEGYYGGDILAAYDSFRDVITHWYDYRGFYYAFYFIINLDLWNSLSPADQKIISDAALYEEHTQIVRAEDVEKAYAQKLTDYGIEVIVFTDEEYANLKAVMVKDVWPGLEVMIGKKLMDEAIAIVGQ